MIIGNFNCEKCSGICCVNPPELRNIDEIKKAIDMDVKIYLIVEGDLVIGAGVAKVAKKCPFLANGKCSIYDERFEACKWFECVSKDEGKFDIREYQKLFRTNKYVKPDKAFKPIKKDEIVKLIKIDNIEFVNVAEYVEKNLLTDLGVLGKYIQKIKEINNEGIYN